MDAIWFEAGMSGWTDAKEVDGITAHLMLLLRHRCLLQRVTSNAITDLGIKKVGNATFLFSDRGLPCGGCLNTPFFKPHKISIIKMMTC